MIRLDLLTQSGKIGLASSTTRKPKMRYYILELCESGRTCEGWFDSREAAVKWAIQCLQNNGVEFDAAGKLMKT